MRKKLITGLILALIFNSSILYGTQVYGAEVYNNDGEIVEESSIDLSKVKEKIKSKAEILVGNCSEFPYYNEVSVQYAISQGGNIIISDNAGVYSKSENRLLSRDNMYGIGSISKMYVTAAVMQLVDEKKVDLDLPLTNYIPEFKMADENYKKITPRMLLNHSSGLMGTTDRNTMLLGDNDTYTHDNLLENLKTQKLKAEPGEFSVYCNDGFSLAEILVEKVSGMSFSQYIEKNFSLPLGLTHTKTPEDSFDRSLLAKTYMSSKFKEDPAENVMSIGAGGIYSSCEDLCKFTSALIKKGDKGLLSEKSVDAMAEKEYLKGVWMNDGDDNMLGYGLGWDNVNTFPFNRYGIKALSKGGDTFCYHSAVITIPEFDITMSVMSSGGSSVENSVFAQNALLELLKEEGKIDDIKADVKWTEEKSQYMPSYLKDEYEGLYDAGNRIIEVQIDKDGTLTLKDPARPHLKAFHHTYSNYFMCDGGNYGIRFVHEKNGKTYIEEKIYDNFPGLGQNAKTLYTGEKIKDNSSMINDLWKERNKKCYFVINEKYSSAVYAAGGGFAFSNIPSDSNGYVNGSRIESDNEAVPCISIPGAVGRDLCSYQFYKQNENGTEVEYLDMGASKLISSDGVPFIDDNLKNVTIGEKGYTRWFIVPKSMGGKTMSVQCSDKTSFNVYDSYGRCRNDSYVTKDKSIQLQAYDIIALAGDPLENFNISFK